MFHTPYRKLFALLFLASLAAMPTGKTEAAGSKQEKSAPAETPHLPESGAPTFSTQEPKVQWSMHKVPGGSCDVRFPTNYKYRENFIQVTPEEAYYTYEANSENDGTTYVVRVEQGFGPPLALSTVRSLLGAESAKYHGFAKSLEGQVTSDEEIKQEGFYGKEIIIAYVEKAEQKSMRVRIFLTDVGRVTIMHVGNADSIYSYRSNSFFETIKLRDGISKRDGDPKKDGWNPYESPNKVYTAFFPAITDEYVPDPPVIKVSENKDFMGITLKDPLRGYLIFYNIYSYKLPIPVTEESAKKLLATQHVVKFAPKFPLDTLNFRTSKKDDHYTMNTQVLANAAPEFPYINSIIFNTHIKGNYIVVQEIISSGSYASSPLLSSLMENIDFHPDKFEQYVPGNTKETSEKKENTASPNVEKPDHTAETKDEKDFKDAPSENTPEAKPVGAVQ